VWWRVSSRSLSPSLSVSLSVSLSLAFRCVVPFGVGAEVV
jgi:hypothetical protein